MHDLDNEAPVSGRRQKRVAFRAPVIISDGVIETQLECVDVCKGGLGVEGDWLWPEGSVVKLRVVLGERSAVARARVARCEGNRMGLEVTFQGPTFQQLLSMLYRCGQRSAPTLRRHTA
jgi:hypothetical protein